MRSPPSSCLAQALIDFFCKDSQHLTLDLIIAQKQGEEVLILLQAFDQRVVNIIEVCWLK